MFLVKQNFSHSPLYGAGTNPTFVARSIYMKPMVDNISVEHLKELSNKIELGMTVVDSAFSLVTLNKYFLHLLNSSLEQVTAQPITAWMHPEDRNEIGSAINDIVNGLPKRQMVCRLLSESGKIKWARVTILPKSLQADSKMHALVLFEPVKNEISAKDGIERTDVALRLVNSQPNEVILLMDSRGVYQWVSSNVTNVLGFSPNHLLGQLHFNLIHSEDRKINGSVNGMSVTEFVNESREVRMKHRSGHYTKVHADQSLLTDSQGKIQLVICHLQMIQQNLETNTKDLFLLKDGSNNMNNHSSEHGTPGEERHLESVVLDIHNMEYCVNDQINLALRNVQSQFSDVPCIFSFPPKYTLRGERGIMTQIWFSLIQNAYTYRNPNRVLEIHISNEKLENVLNYSFETNASLLEHSTVIHGGNQSAEETGVDGIGINDWSKTLGDLLSKINGTLTHLEGDESKSIIHFSIPVFDQLKIKDLK